MAYGDTSPCRVCGAADTRDKLVRVGAHTRFHLDCYVRAGRPLTSLETRALVRLVGYSDPTVRASARALLARRSAA